MTLDDGPVHLTIHARPKWNPETGPGLRVEAGQVLRFQASGTWKDWFRTETARGWDAAYMAPFRRFRRRRDANFFALIGAFDRDDRTNFRIDLDGPQTMPRSGDLFFYANDVPWAYGNNDGALQLTVSRA